MRAGDHVYHVPSGEEWVVAYIEGNRLAWCGWPAGTALLSDCRIVKACTDDEHLELLHRMAEMSGYDHRKSRAIRELELLSTPAQE